MLTYHLDAQSGVPLYEQLYRAVRADIMSGALAGGTRLPSKRQLAANLRISQITVETATVSLPQRATSFPRRDAAISCRSRSRRRRPFIRKLCTEPWENIRETSGMITISRRIS